MPGWARGDFLWRARNTRLLDLGANRRGTFSARRVVADNMYHLYTILKVFHALMMHFQRFSSMPGAGLSSLGRESSVPLSCPSQTPHQHLCTSGRAAAAGETEAPGPRGSRSQGLGGVEPGRAQQQFPHPPTSLPLCLPLRLPPWLVSARNRGGGGPLIPRQMGSGHV